MRFRPGIAFVLLACLAPLAPLAPAAVVLDQHYESLPVTGFGGPVAKLGIDIAQTFTVGVDGQLTRVEFNIARTANTTAPLLVDIRATDASGVPQAANTPVLASATLDASAVGVAATTVSGPFTTSSFAFLGVDLSAANLHVTPGQLLAITLRSEEPVGGYLWAFTIPDPYAGGHGWFRGHGDQPFQRGGADQYFRTFVDTPDAVPVPSAAWAGAALFGLMFAVRVRSARRRRQPATVRA